MYIQNKREKDKNVEAFDEGPQEEKEEKSFGENSEKCIKTLLVILSEPFQYVKFSSLPLIKSKHKRCINKITT